MIKKTIKFVDFDGVEQEKDYWFNLSKADLAEMALYHEGGSEGLAKFFEEIALSRDFKRIVPQLKKMIALSYGERVGENGFKKSEEITDSFVGSPGYDELMYELLSDVDTFQTFFLGVLPPDLSAKAAQEVESPATHTLQQLIEMDDEQFDSVAGTDIRKMDKIHLVAAMQRRSNKLAMS